MKYILIALLNAIYGLMTLQMLTKDTPGYDIIFVIAIVLAFLGLAGIVLYIIMLVSNARHQPPRTELIKNWFQFTKNIDIVLIIGLLFRAFILQPYIVDGNSMENSFHNNEYVLVDQITYHFRAPQHEETIVFHPPIDPSLNYIKRIIGLPGDTVAISNNIVTVNGHVLTENYIYPGSTTETSQPNFSVTLKSNQYFVMGDNRDHSSDSREWGVVPKENIVGRAWFVVYPTKYFGLVKSPTFNLMTMPSPSAILNSISSRFSLNTLAKYA